MRHRVFRHERDHRLYPAIRKGYAQHSSRNGENYALGEELLDDTLAARTQGDPHRDFALPRASSREQEICDVCASDQQQKSHCGEQRQKRVGELPEDPFVHRLEFCVERRFRIDERRSCFRKFLVEALKLGVDLLLRDAGLHF